MPGEMTRAKASGNRLGLLRAGVVAEAVVGQAQGLGQEPALAIVLRQEGVEAQGL